MSVPTTKLLPRHHRHSFHNGPMSTNPSIPDPRVLDDLKDIDVVFGRVVVPVPNQNKALKKGKLGEFSWFVYSSGLT